MYVCCDHLRRTAIEGTALNGIDYLEVLDRDAPTAAERQRTLFVRFVNAAPALAKTNLRIDGGERVMSIRVTGVANDPTDNRLLRIKVDQPGDFSRYTLRLVQDEQHLEAPAGIDPVLASVEFSFKAECASGFDCRPRCVCAEGVEPAPEIDYLAKDYASFRRLMLDRMAELAPAWRERNPADIAVALVELFAYVGDYLSYQQDAIATEAYLGTARRRVSVRRHARLVDYPMHDGCNARAWVQLRVSDNVAPVPGATVVLAKGTPCCTSLPGLPVLLADPAVVDRADAVFETVEDVAALFKDHNEMRFYTWSDEECCLPAGAKAATLDGHLPNLRSGEVIVLEEVLGPLTGAAIDADPSRRQAVRLTRVDAFDAGAPRTDPLTGAPITDIEWMDEDALCFPMCISARTDEDHGKRLVRGVSVASGNIVLVDHGRSQDREDLLPVPPPRLFLPQIGETCSRGDPVPVPPRYRPALARGPLTQVAGLPAATPASRSLISDPRGSVPAITLESTVNTDTLTWKPRLDLLENEGSDAVFVAETDVDGGTTLRFGDDRHGRRPQSGMDFTANYRVGTGVAGNVGRETITHVLSQVSAISAIRNPMPAVGGVEPESMEDVRQRAPTAFRTQERAVTEGDYGLVTERREGIQRAAGTFRWTGSWHTVFLTVDRVRGLKVDAPFEQAVRDFVEPFRMAGYDLEVDSPRLVSLEIEMDVCAKPQYFRSEVKEALLEAFSSRDLPSGGRGIFHPDEFSFGQPVYLSRLYAAAQAVDGVDSVRIKVFQRQGIDDPGPLSDGVLRLDRLEIARLDNDPSFPEHGVFTINVAGGK